MSTVLNSRTVSTCHFLAPILNIVSTSPPIKSFATLLNHRQSIVNAFAGGEMATSSSSSSGDSTKTAASGNDGDESARRSRILSSKLYFDVHTSKVKFAMC